MVVPGLERVAVEDLALDEGVAEPDVARALLPRVGVARDAGP